MWGLISRIVIGAAVGAGVVLLLLFGIQELFPHANVPHFVGNFFSDLAHFVQSLGSGK